MLPPEITTRIAELAQTGQRVIIAVAGPAGSGKSTVAEALADALGPTAAVLLSSRSGVPLYSLSSLSILASSSLNSGSSDSSSSCRPSSRENRN